MNTSKLKDEDFKTSRWTGGIIRRCVAVAIKNDGVAIRDTKDPDKTTLVYTRDEWQAFINGVKAGEFDL